MISIELKEKFTEFLTSSISQSISEKINSTFESIATKGLAAQIVSLAKQVKDGDRSMRDRLFMQKRLLSVAENYIHYKPWISYFAALKSIVYLRNIGITSEALDSLQDKEYAEEVEIYAEKIMLESEARLDAETTGLLRELISRP